MAATAELTIVITYASESPTSVSHRAMRRYDKPHQALELLINELRRMQQGNSIGKVHAVLDDASGTAAIGRVACTQASISSGDTVVVSGVTFTAKTSPSTDPSAGEFAFLTSDTVTAAALAAAINAHPALKGLLTAAGSSGNCNITLTDKGIHGNYLTLAKTGSGFALTQVASLTPGVRGAATAEMRTYMRGMP